MRYFANAWPTWPQEPMAAPSQEFLQISPERALLVLVQFFHLSAFENRAQSFNIECQFSRLVVS
jgi:hypothetical protein